MTAKRASCSVLAALVTRVDGVYHSWSVREGGGKNHNCADGLVLRSQIWTGTASGPVAGRYGRAVFASRHRRAARSRCSKACSRATHPAAVASLLAKDAAEEFAAIARMRACVATAAAASRSAVSCARTSHARSTLPTGGKADAAERDLQRAVGARGSQHAECARPSRGGEQCTAICDSSARDSTGEGIASAMIPATVVLQ